MKSFFTFLVGFLALICAQLSLASPVAFAVAGRGEVSVVDSYGVERPLEIGGQVYEQELVKTKSKGFVVLQFEDGARITIRPDSELAVEQYDQYGAELSLVAGGVRVLTGTLAKTHPDDYIIKTPVALMGVRGTEFAVVLCDDLMCE